MRLTLRTMLAYLDDILEPSDAEELGHKIEESKFASDLVHRIRNSTRRLRLGAPKLAGKGMGLDPNTVAEYLDNTLPSQHVPDFEKVCLESDVHLAEVASCHQILTIVLGEPADIEHALRERVYRIGHPSHQVSSSGSHAAAESALDPQLSSDQHGASSAVGLVSKGETTGRQAGKVPDYMRSGGRISVKSLAATLFFTFVLAIVALRAVGPFNRQHLVARLLLGAPRAEVAERPGQLDEEPVDQARSQVTEPAPEVPPARLPDDASPVADMPPQVPATPKSREELPGGDESPEVAAPAAEPPSSESVPESTPPDTSAPPVAPVEPAGEPDEESAAAEPAPRRNVGRYISEEQLLARFVADRESPAWFRVAPDSSLFNGDDLLTFPTYRPQLLLSPGVKLTLSDETSLQLQPPDESGAPRLSLHYGRVVAVPVSEPNAWFTLQLDGREAGILFADLDSTAAIEVKRYLPPGSDPETTSALVVVQVFAGSGQIGWREGSDAPVVINAGQVLTCIDRAPVAVADAGPLPEWIQGRHLVDIERRASRELLKFLDIDRPLSLSLMERTDFRQQEIVALACRSLCGIDIYDPIIEALGEKYQHSYWDSHFASLKSAVARGPESAAGLRRMIEKLHGEDAESLYRLVWGFSPDQLAHGAAAELVDDLEHPEMSVRVLAYQNLERITGMTQLFRPELPPDQEKNKTKWRKALQEGRIVYQKPPVPLEPRDTAPAPRE